MINAFQGIGNLGSAPTLTPVTVNGETRNVANMRVYFDRRVAVDEEYQDKGGFWLTVDIWGYRADEAIRVLKKGSRVFVSGTLRQDEWDDENGEAKTAMRLSADYFFIDSICVESVSYRNKKYQDQSLEQHVSHEF